MKAFTQWESQSQFIKFWLPFALNSKLHCNGKNIPGLGSVVGRFFSAIFCSTSSRFCLYPAFSGSRDNAYYKKQKTSKSS